MAEQTIKYDGSETELKRLGLIDESGSMNVKMRNEYNEYMSQVAFKTMHQHTK